MSKKITRTIFRNTATCAVLSKNPETGKLESGTIYIAHLSTTPITDEDTEKHVAKVNPKAVVESVEKEVLKTKCTLEDYLNIAQYEVIDYASYTATQTESEE